MCVYIYIYIYVYTCVYMYIYIYIYIWCPPPPRPMDPPFPGVPSTTALRCLSSRAEGQGLGVRGIRFGVWGSCVEKLNGKNLNYKT